MNNRFTRQVSITSNEMNSDRDAMEVHQATVDDRNDDDDGEDGDGDMGELSQLEVIDLYRHYTQRSLDDDDYEEDPENDNNCMITEELSQEQEAIEFELGSPNNAAQLKQQVTLTQTFLTKTPCSSGRKLKDATISEKKRRKLDQQTLTQTFDSRSPTCSTTNYNSPQLKDTEDRVYSDTNDKVSRVFKRNEAFRINHPDYTDSICVIDSFTTKGTMTKYGVGHVYQKLKRTYIGGIKKQESFRNYVKESNLDGDQYVQHKDEQNIPLKCLGSIVEDFVPPSTIIIYEKLDGSKRCFGLDGHGFTISYRHTRCCPVKIEDSPSWEHEFDDYFRQIEPDKKDRIDDASATRTAIEHKQSEAHVDDASKNCAPSIQSDCLKPIELLTQEIAKFYTKSGSRSVEGLHLAKAAVVNENYELTASLATVEAENKANLKKIESLKQEFATLKEHPLQQQIKREEKISVLDCFAGIGGMSRGLIEAGGYDVKWAVEKNHGAAAMFRLNHDDTFLFEEDIFAWFTKMERMVERKNGTASNKNHDKNPYLQVLKAQHLHFSPPCQKFSTANRGGGANDAANAFLTLFCIDVIRFFHLHGIMKSVSMENVTGLLSPHNGNENYLKTVVSSLIGIGMDVRIAVLDSSRYGDPQKRNRVFVTACKPDLALHDFPRETHHKDDLSLSRLVTATNALGGISRVDPTEGNGFAELVLHDGSSVFIQNHCKDGTNKQADLEELKPHEPAHTVRRKANIKHYEHDRTLTVREMALLQSFGYDFQFCGSQKQQVDGIGNAVPIKVAKAVALAIKDMYNV